jgi:hypothetical protein
MNNKLNQILIGLLVAQIALAVTVFWPRGGAQAQSGPLLAGFKAAEVTSVSISDNEGHKIMLVKTGDAWVLPQADDFPADGSKITPFLEKIEKIQGNRLVTRTEASQKRLQVAADGFNRLVELSGAGGAAQTLYLGSVAGAGATHVRAGAAPEVFLTAELSSWDAAAEASAWIDTLVFTLPQTATVALTLENANGKFEFEKFGDGWAMTGLAEGETLNQNAVTTLVNVASGVRMTAPLGKTAQDAYGLNAPQAVVTLKTADNTYTLNFGAADPADESYVLKASNSDYFVRVAAFTGDSFIAKTRADFLEAPPTPAAGNSGS